LKLSKLLIAAAALASLAGCAVDKLHREGLELAQQGQPEAGMGKFREALQLDPGRIDILKDLRLQRALVNDRKIVQGRQLQDAGQPGAAAQIYRELLIDDPNQQAAQEGLRDIDRAQRHQSLLAQAEEAVLAGDESKARTLLQQVLLEAPESVAARELSDRMEHAALKKTFQDPVLRPPGAKRVHLDFRDASVRMVFEVLSRNSGLNFIVDKDVAPDLKTTVFLRNAYVDEAIDLILRTSQLRRKLLGNGAVLIYPDTPEKQRTYEDLVVRAFYLRDATAAQMQTTLKTLLKAEDLVVDEKLNLLVMRGTPDAIRVAEKLVALHDLAEPEVMLEMEVLEVQQDALMNLGISWPQQLSLTPLTSGNAALTLQNLRNLNSSRIGASIGPTTINLREDNGLSNLLANPRVRVRNREQATIMIGDKVPVFTTTSTATGFVSESVQYLDVGLKLSVEPTVHPPRDVGIKVNLEVSSIAKQISTAGGSVAYQIGTRNATTVLRLQDGQTQILAGLINDQDRTSSSGVPGLSRLPMVGRLFTSPLESRTKNEIVLSITPRLVRGAARPDAHRIEFWSGTASVLHTQPLRFAGEEPAAAVEAPKSVP
jgi:general secretion pathway protein D